MVKLCYFRDWTTLKGQAKIVSSAFGDSNNVTVRLDRTVFYPQGGGQPSDQGHLSCKDCSLQVKKVAFAPDDDVDHQCIIERGTVTVGDEIEMVVDEGLRLWHCRLHSAGHVVDGALAVLGIKSLNPGKAYHFEDGPYVEYDGIVEGMTKEELAKAVEAACKELIKKDLPVFIDFATADEEDTKCMRSMRIDDLISIPCGGTHVSRLGEIRDMGIRKVEVKKGKTRICYSIDK